MTDNLQSFDQIHPSTHTPFARLQMKLLSVIFHDYCFST